MFKEWSGLEAELSLTAAGPWKNCCPAGKSLQQSPNRVWCPVSAAGGSRSSLCCDATWKSSLWAGTNYCQELTQVWAVPAQGVTPLSHQRISGTLLVLAGDSKAAREVWWRAALLLCVRRNYNWERKKWFLILFSAVPNSWSSDCVLCFLLPTGERHLRADVE